MSDMAPVVASKRKATALRDDRIVELLGAGRQMSEVAALLGVNVRTVFRRAAHPVIAARITEARGAQLEPFVTQTTRAVGPMLDRLEAATTDPTIPPAARIRAMTAYIEIALKLREQVDVYPRLALAEALAREAERKAATGRPTEEPTKLSDLLARLEARKQQHHPEDSADDS